MDVNLTITDKAKRPFSLKTAGGARSFLEAEERFWAKQREKLGKNLDPNLASCQSQIKAFLDRMNALEEAESADPSPNNLNQLRQAFQQAKPSFTTWMAQHWISRESPFVEAMLAAYEYSQVS